ncbi:holo-ACP synthase [Uliginosibacterium sediminicola]|uniref:Holo-[acyl-carrier-protein] synthase n=1 Tax=Uliginosibacterium sediminicola TaxID=2024550 RepID=A0ABU9YZJ3_9RHOO
MIYGIGTDIVAVERIRAGLARHGERYGEMLLTPAEREELARAQDPARFIAKRFAAKEAFSKAFGTGLRGIVSLQTVAVAHDDLGKPLYALNTELDALMQQRGLSAQLSISDEKEYVVAFAIIEQQSK